MSVICITAIGVLTGFFAVAFEARGERHAQVVPPTHVATPAVATDDARLNIAIRMLKSGDFEASATTCRTVLKQTPSIDRAAAILGIALTKQKKYEEARPNLERARDSKQTFPEHAHAAHFLGWCCYHLGELACAKSAFELHLTAFPDAPDSMFGLGLVALSEDRLDDAQSLLNKALAGFTAPVVQRNDQARVLVRLADLALRRDDVVGAEALLERAIAATPTQHEAWAKIARVRDRLGKHETADVARANERRILEALGRTTAPTDTPPIVPSDAPISSPTNTPSIAPAPAPSNVPTTPSTTPSTTPNATNPRSAP